MSFRNATSFAGIAIVLVYVIGSGLWVNTGDSWYANLNKPSWQPPGFIFGIIWPYNFVVLGIAAFAIGQRASKPVALTYMAFFALSVFAALLWAYQFYRPHNLTTAAIALSWYCCSDTSYDLYFVYYLATSGDRCYALSSVGGDCCHQLSWRYSQLN
jgi:translocator protein